MTEEQIEDIVYFTYKYDIVIHIRDTRKSYDLYVLGITFYLDL